MSEALKDKPMVTIGIDSSTTNCGIAVFEDGKLTHTHNYKFSGTYSIEKLKKISDTFVEVFDDLEPNMVILERPAPVRNSKTLTALNQVAGAIWGIAVAKDIFIATLHNKTIKKIMNVKSKEDAIKVVEETFGVKVETDHEADAALTVEAYKINIENKGIDTN